MLAFNRATISLPRKAAKQLSTQDLRRLVEAKERAERDAAAAAPGGLGEGGVPDSMWCIHKEREREMDLYIYICNIHTSLYPHSLFVYMARARRIVGLVLVRTNE